MTDASPRQPAGSFDAAVVEAAETLGCEPLALAAVIQVEAAGDWTAARFEPHKFPRRYWPALGFEPGSRPPWRASLRLAVGERARMRAVAGGIDRELAEQAASHGGFQIMGFNAAAAGLPSAIALAEMCASGFPPPQIEAFTALILSWRLDGALRAQDWLAFARRYNGGGQPHVYAERMEAAYARLAGRGSPEVLRAGDRGAAVAALQRALGGAGFDIDEDGVFGPETHEAVELFQASAALAVDGLVGARTWAALRARADVEPPEKAPPVAEAAEIAAAIAETAQRLQDHADAVRTLAA